MCAIWWLRRTVGKMHHTHGSYVTLARFPPRHTSKERPNNILLTIEPLMKENLPMVRLQNFLLRVDRFFIKSLLLLYWRPEWTD